MSGRIHPTVGLGRVASQRVYADLCITSRAIGVRAYNSGRLDAVYVREFVPNETYETSATIFSPAHTTGWPSLRNGLFCFKSLVSLASARNYFAIAWKVLRNLGYMPCKCVYSIHKPEFLAPVNDKTTIGQTYGWR